MKTTLFTIILLLSGATTLQAQFFYYPFPPAKADYALNEKAQVKICYEYGLSGNEKSLSRTLEYGNEGLPAALYQRGTDDNGDSITVEESYYKYANGRLVQEEVLNHEGDGGYKTVYTYNAAGRLIEKVEVQADPPTYTYVYDKSGRAIKATIKVKMPDENEKLVDVPQGWEEYTYNTKGQLIQATNYTQDNEKMFIFQWQYNAKGQIIKVTGLRPEGDLAFEETLEYGKNNLLAKRTKNSPGEEPEIYVYEYCTDCTQSWKKQ
jgi:YD repeat-containing protein